MMYKNILGMYNYMYMYMYVYTYVVQDVKKFEDIPALQAREEERRQVRNRTKNSPLS